MIDEDNFDTKTLPQTPQQLKLLLTNSFLKLAKTSPNNKEISQAHEQIGLAMKHGDFISVSIQLLLEHQDKPQSNTFVTQIMTTFTTFMRHQQARSPLVYKMNHFDLNSQIIKIALNGKIKSKWREGLLKHYPQFIYSPGMQTIRTQTVNQMCQAMARASTGLINAVNQPNFLQRQEVQMLYLFYPIVKIIAKGPIQTILLKRIVQQFLKPSLVTALRQVQALQLSIDSGNQQQFLQIIKPTTTIVEFVKDLCLAACNSTHMHYLQEQIYNQKTIGQLVVSCFCLSLKPKQGKPVVEVIIKYNESSPILNDLNVIKKHCMELTITLIKELIDLQRKSKHEKKIVSEREYEMIAGIIRFIINNMITVFVSEIRTSEYPDKPLPCPMLCKNFINVLSFITRVKAFYNEMLALRNILLLDICILILSPSKTKEIRSARDFIGIKQDILNQQGMDLVQNAAGKLIESYIDKIDGSVTLLCKSMINLINFQLTANPIFIKALPQDFVESYFFEKVSYLGQIQAAFMILALISYMAPGRQQITILVEDLFRSRITFLVSESSPATLKCSMLLCYTYYVDDFYQLLVQKNSVGRQVHLQILEECCSNIKKYTQTDCLSQISKEQQIMLQIAARQSVDCLSNCLPQKNFFQALLKDDQIFTPQKNLEIFMSIIKFIVFQIQYSLNIDMIALLWELYEYNLKKSIKKKSMSGQYHYDSDNVNHYLRNQVSQLLSRELVKLYERNDIPDSVLMKAKIMNLLQCVVTCCQDPNIVITRKFLTLKLPENHESDTVDCIDIYLRRILKSKAEGKQLNFEILELITDFAIKQISYAIKDMKFKPYLGIFINLMLIHPPLISKMIESLGKTLLQLLNDNLNETNYDEKLEDFIKEVAYLLMVGIKLCFTEQNKIVWTEIVSLLSEFCAEQSSKGFILFSSSSPYMGKIMTLSMVCIYNMRHSNLNRQRLNFIFKNTIKDENIYKHDTEQLIIAKTLINLLDQKQSIGENDQDCINSLKVVCNLLYSNFSKKGGVGMDEEDAFESDESSEQDGQQANQIEYKQYTVNANEYTMKEDKDSYLFSLKNLCRKLQQKSPDFLKNTVDLLSFPVQKFLKEKVYYFEGSINAKGLRKIIKVKQ